MASTTRVRDQDAVLEEPTTEMQQSTVTQEQPEAQKEKVGIQTLRDASRKSESTDLNTGSKNLKELHAQHIEESNKLAKGEKGEITNVDNANNAAIKYQMADRKYRDEFTKELSDKGVLNNKDMQKLTDLDRQRAESKDMEQDVKLREEQSAYMKDKIDQSSLSQEEKAKLKGDIDEKDAMFKEALGKMKEKASELGIKVEKLSSEEFEKWRGKYGDDLLKMSPEAFREKYPGADEELTKIIAAAQEKKLKAQSGEEKLGEGPSNAATESKEEKATPEQIRTLQQLGEEQKRMAELTRKQADKRIDELSQELEQKAIEAENARAEKQAVAQILKSTERTSQGANRPPV